MKILKTSIAVVAAVVLAGGAGSALAWAVAVPEQPEPPRPAPFETNAAGETFGSALGAEIDPDLILASGVDGVVGYVRAADLNGPDFSSPEEALRYQEEHGLLSGQDREVPLYDSDGKTVIGTFVLVGGAGAEPLLEDEK